MKTRFFVHASVSVLVLATAALSAFGCSGETPTPNPIVQTSVELSAFCGQFDKILCAGATSCCSGADLAYASVDECLAESTCENGAIGKAFQSPLLTDGTISYDPKAAADFLNTANEFTSKCGAADRIPLALPFFVGTRAEGADCSPVMDDRTNTFSCKPGLTCVVERNIGVCQNLPTEVPPTGGYGAACSTDDDCSTFCDNGQCGPDGADLLCLTPPAIETPANADTPGDLWVKTHNSSNAGTSATVTVGYNDGNGNEYTCTVTPTAKNTGYHCTPTLKSSIAFNTKSLTVEHSSTDGLRVAKICVRTSSLSDIWCKDNFQNGRAAVCEGCSSYFGNAYCTNCWVDNGDHGDCGRFVAEPYDTHCKDRLTTSTSTITPTYLQVDVFNATEAGTTGDIELAYNDGAGTEWGCTITETLASNTSYKCLVGSSYSTGTSIEGRSFNMRTTSNDGLRYTKVCVLDANSSELDCVSDFDPVGTYTQCEGCNTYGNSCGSCWLDTNNHGKCDQVSISMDNNNLECSW